MTNKQILFLGISAVALLGIFLLLQRNSIPKSELRMLAEVDSALVDEVSIYNDGQSLTLTRTDKGWMMTNPVNYRANKSFMKTMLGKLNEMKIESEVTSNKENWANYEVDQEKGSRITIKQGAKRDDVVIGKVSSGYKQTYARRESEDTVYMITGTYSTFKNRQIDNWREKKVGDFEDSEVIKITTNEYILSKEGEEWKLTDPKGKEYELDQSKVQRITSSVARIRTSDFPDSSEYAGVNWNKPLNLAHIELASGAVRDIKFYEESGNDSRYFFKYGDMDYVFRAYKAIYGQIFKTPEDFKIEEKAE